MSISNLFVFPCLKAFIAMYTDTTITNAKNEIANIINGLKKENYQNILNDLFKLISNKNKNNENSINADLNLNNYEILLNNQFTFVEVVVEKSIEEKNFDK